MKRFWVVLLFTGVTLTFGLATGFSLFYRLTYLLALALGGSLLWAFLNLRWLEVGVKRGATRAQVGDRVEETVTVSNRGFLPKAWLEVQDLTDMPTSIPGKVVSLSGRSVQSWRGYVEVRRRGVYTVGPIQVASEDPFGIYYLKRTFLGQQRLTVYPRIVSVPYLRVPAAEMPGEGTLRRRTHYITPHAASVREYMPGDSFSRVHWPTTARTGELMVKEFDIGLGSNLWLFLDLQEGAQTGSAEHSTEEYAVSIAASLAKKYVSVSMPVGLVGYGDKRYFLVPERGQGQVLKLLELLALARGQGKSPIQDVLALEGARLSRMATAVVITSSLEAAWVDALGPLAHRGVRLVAIVVDPTSFGKGGSSAKLLEHLAQAGVSYYVIRRGDDLTQALAHPYGLAPVAATERRQESLV